MNQEQLRFNLDMAPDPARLATTFKLRPSPVVIERLYEQDPASSETGSSIQLNSLDARMELASRLARRDIENNKLRVDSRIPGAVHSSILNQPKSIEQRSEREREWQDCPRKKEEMETRSKHRKKRIGLLTAPERVKTGGLAGCSVCIHQRNGQSEKSEIEIARVRKELLRQACRLRQLTLTRQPVNSSLSKKSVQEKPHRVGRLDLAEGEREREARRAEEQGARNARMLYQLQQMINQAKRECDQLCQHDQQANRDASKSQALQRLAAAHRSALRAMQNMINTALAREGSDVTPSRVSAASQLASLVEQLSLLYSQLKGEPLTHEDALLRAMLTQLKSHLQPRSPHLQVPRLHDNSMPNQKVLTAQRTPRSHPGRWVTRHAHQWVRKKRGSATNRRVGVLLRQQRRPAHSNIPLAPPSLPATGEQSSEPHYTQQTFSSIQRRSPRKKHPVFPMPPSSSHSSTPPCITSSANSVHGEKGGLASDIESSSMGEQAGFLTLPVHHHSDPTEKELAQQVWLDTMISQQAQEIKQLKKETKKQLSQIQQQLQQPQQLVEESEPAMAEKHQAKALSQQTKPLQIPCSAQRSIPSQGSKKVADLLLEDVVTDTMQEADRIEMSGDTEKAAVLYQKQPCLEQMAQRMEELEAEELHIREKWSAMTYNDPLHPVPCMAVSREGAPVHRRLTIRLPRDLVSRAHSYRDQFLHHLRLTGTRTDTKLNSWQLVERISDNLLNELVGEVVEEIDRNLDSCVQTLFDSEFHRPS